MMKIARQWVPIHTGLHTIKALKAEITLIQHPATKKWSGVEPISSPVLLEFNYQNVPCFPLQALLVNKHGQGRLVDGPQRVFVINKRFERLARYSADQKQYLRIHHRDGTIEHMPG